MGSAGAVAAAKQASNKAFKGIGNHDLLSCRELNRSRMRQPRVCAKSRNAALGLVVVSAMLWQGLASTSEAHRQKVVAALDSVIGNLQELVRVVEMTAHSTERVIRTVGTHNPDNLRAALETAVTAFELRPELSHLGLTLFDTGQQGNLERTATNDVLLWLYPGQAAGTARRLQLTDTGFVIQEEWLGTPQRARLEAVRQAGLRAGRAGGWGIRQNFWQSDEQAPPDWRISYTQALYDEALPDGARGEAPRFFGVLDANFNMAVVRAYMDNLQRVYDVDLDIVEFTQTAAGKAAARRVGSATDAPQPVPPAYMDFLTQAARSQYVAALVIDDQRRWLAARPMTLKGEEVTGIIVASRRATWLDTLLGQQIWHMLAVLLALAIGLALIAHALARRFGQPLAELVTWVTQMSQPLPTNATTATPPLPATAQHAALPPNPSSTLNHFRETQILAHAMEEAAQAITLQTTRLLQEKSALRRLNVELQYRATHHPLTELPNRVLMLQRIDQAIAQANGGTVNSPPHFAILYLDLDRFKAVNDAYGHSFGSRALKAAGAALTRLVGPQDTVAHLSGDRFLILLANLRDANDAEHLTSRILTGIRAPLSVEGVNIQIGSTIGVSIYPQHGDTADALITHADIAMYAAKRAGRGNWCVYTPEMGVAVQQRAELETHLRATMDANFDQLHLAYQPQVSLASGHITGCEALLRWTHPQLGVISPARFIPVAEESGLIMTLGDWVLTTACRQTKAWLDAGLSPLRTAINLSMRQFLQQDVVAWVTDTLARTGLPAQYLELEITESLLPHDLEKAIATLQQLREIGVTLALDDFGTGYSNLSYLKRFPIDVLKIDQSFIRTAISNPEDTAIVRTVITLAHQLRFKTLAEGVETEEQLRFLREHGCEEIQGYYFSKPLDAQAFAALLRDCVTLESKKYIS